jgi:CRP/FNR family transcriptional regulator, cyclic AMP receptor protein
MSPRFLNRFRKRLLAPQLRRLSELSLFSALTPGELRIVAALMHQRNHLAGEIIFDEGEEGQALYVILEGRVEIRRASIDSTGGMLAELQPGAFFGDMALLDASPRTAQARAACACSLTVFFREDFMRLMDTHARIASKVALQMARQMGARIRQSTGERSSVHAQL